jgi:hypothetical protein
MAGLSPSVTHDVGKHDYLADESSPPFEIAMRLSRRRQVLVDDCCSSSSLSFALQ